MHSPPRLLSAPHSARCASARRAAAPAAPAAPAATPAPAAPAATPPAASASVALLCSARRSSVLRSPTARPCWRSAALRSPCAQKSEYASR